MMKIFRRMLPALLLTLGCYAHAQCPATSLPFTDGFSGTGSNLPCWTAVVGPGSSEAGQTWSGTFVPASAKGFAVATFTGVTLSGDQGISAPISFTAGSYPAITLDQDASGGAIALEPSLDAIYEVLGNSVAAHGGKLCAGSAPAASGHIYSLTRSGSTYTAKDETTGTVLCSASNTAHHGAPGIQADWRTGTMASSIGPVTITGTVATTLNQCALADGLKIPTLPKSYPRCALAANAIRVAVDGQKVNVLATAAELYFQYCWGSVCSQPQPFFRNRVSVQANNSWIGGNPTSGKGTGTLYALQTDRPATMQVTVANGTAKTITVPALAGSN